MNNVWTAIALRAPCTARQTTRTPLLQLFNGYARLHSSRCASQRATSASEKSILDRRISSYRSQPGALSCDFSTTAFLPERHGRVKSAPKSTPKSKLDAHISLLNPASKLEPAPTIASHTEGLAPEEPELTWRDYDPVGGMPLPDGEERSQVQINGIFGSEDLNADTGNYILSVMYWRRMSGALIDSGLDFPKDSRVTRLQARKGLEYVRSLDPQFDEQAAGQVWAEEESARLKGELEERALKLGLYKRDEPKEEELEEEEEDSTQGTPEGRERNQESALQRLRAANKARSDQERAEKEAAEAKAGLAAVQSRRGPLELSAGVQPSVETETYTGPTGITIIRPQTSVWLQPVERKAWVKRYEDRAEIIKENKIPQLSTIRRLGPSFIFVLAVLWLAVFVSDNYTPPPTSARIWPDTKPAVATIAALSGTIVACFLLSRLPPLWRTFNQYFVMVPAYPRVLSILGSTFRHDPLIHLATNMASLWLFGLILHEDVGRGTFLSVFFASAAVGSFTTLTYNVLRKNWNTYIFGSSNAVLGVVAAACTLRPNGSIEVFGREVPIAAWVFLALWAVSEVGAVVVLKRTGLDHAGHLGGLFTGFVAAMALRRKAASQGREIGEAVESEVVAPLADTVKSS